MKNLKLWIAATAVIGPAVSYSSVYIFHFFAMFWVFMVVYFSFQGKKILISQPQFIYPVLFIYVYTLISILWHPDLITWLRYQFYLMFGLISLLSVYQFVSDKQDLNRVFYILSVLTLLNIFFGLLESLEIIRLPSSKYSPYAGYLGYDAIALDEFKDGAIEYLSNKPTGFNYNHNTFGFIVVLVAPFLLFSLKWWAKTLGMVVILWLLLIIGSKALFVSFIVLIVALPYFFKLSYKTLTLVCFLFPLILVIFSVPLLWEVLNPEVLRMYTVLDEASKLATLMLSGDITVNNSTSARAFIYSSGLKFFFESYGLGVGFGGAEYHVNASFHFFFLQLLIDLGLVMFLVFMFFYFKLIRSLRKISLTTSDRRLSYFSRASSLSLIVAIPASLAPSGIHYLLFFYLLIGFSLAILKIHKEGLINDNCVARRCQLYSYGTLG